MKKFKILWPLLAVLVVVAVALWILGTVKALQAFDNVSQVEPIKIDVPLAQKFQQVSFLTDKQVEEYLETAKPEELAKELDLTDDDLEYYRGLLTTYQKMLGRELQTLDGFLQNGKIDKEEWLNFSRCLRNSNDLQGSIEWLAEQLLISKPVSKVNQKIYLEILKAYQQNKKIAMQKLGEILKDKHEFSASQTENFMNAYEELSNADTDIEYLAEVILQFNQD